MAEAPVYESKLRIPDAGNLAVSPQQVPQIGESAVGAAAQQFGQTLGGAGALLERAQQHTRSAGAMSEYIKTLDELETKYSRDTDFQNAPQNFRREANIARDKALATAQLGPEAQAEFSLRVDRLDLASNGRVKQAAYTRETDANVATLGVTLQQLQIRHARAGSPEEAKAVEDEAFSAIAQQQKAGWISARGGEGLAANWRKERDQISIMRLVRDNPARALQALNNPGAFPDLDPLVREQAINQAQAANDVRVKDALVNEAHFAPHMVSARLGRVIAPQHADEIFMRGIMPIENGPRDNTLVSEAGALGVSQVMPMTAREIAQQLARTDPRFAALNKLDDEAFKKALTGADAASLALNQRIGMEYWRQQVARYNGNIYAAALAYHSGGTRADVWAKKAEDQFGPNYSPEQLISVIPAGHPRAREYVAKLTNVLGVDPAGVQLSPHAMTQTTAAVGAILQQEQVRQQQASAALASAYHAQGDPVALLIQGYNLDPAFAQNYKQAQRDAASAGDKQALERLRNFEQAEIEAPFMQQAYRMNPRERAAALDEMETLARTHYTTPMQQARYRAYRAVEAETVKLKNSDPVSLMERAGFVPDKARVNIPADFDPNNKEHMTALIARGQQAAAASVHLETQTLMPLKPAEVEALKTRYAQLPERGRAAFLNSVVANAPDELATAFLGQVGVDAKSIVAAQLTRGRPEMLQQIMAGQALLKEEGVKAKSSDLRSAAADALGGSLWPDKAVQDAVTDAAVALYVARRGTEGTLYAASDKDALQKAIEDIAGKLTRRGGWFATKPVLAPPGVQPSEFNAVLDNFDQTSVQLFGGAFDRNGQQLDPRWLGRNAVLKQLDPASPYYAVMIGENPVHNVDGKPLVIDYEALARHHGELVRKTREQQRGRVWGGDNPFPKG